jgi:YHS domain-containing protein
MKKNLIATIILGLSLTFAGFAVAADSAPKGSYQTKCPVMEGKIDKKIHADHKGKRVYFCCSGCFDEFKKDPDKYIKKLEAEGVTLEKSP